MDRDQEIVDKTIREALDAAKHHMVPGREQSVTITKLEEALLWSKASDIINPK